MARLMLFPKRLREFFAADQLLPLLLKNAGYLASGTFATAFIGLLQGVLSARMLGVEGYGLLILVMTIVTTVNTLTSARTGEFVVRSVTEGIERGSYDNAGQALSFSYIIEAGLALVAFLLVVVLAPTLANWFFKQESDGTSFILLFNLSILVRLLPETATGVLQAFKAFRLLAWLMFAQSAWIMAGLLVVFFIGPSLVRVLLAFVIATGLHGLSLQFITLRLVRSRLGSGWWQLPQAVAWRPMARFLFATNLGSTMSLVVKTSDPLWLGFFRNPAEVAYYRIAFALATVVATPMSMLSQTFQTDINALVAKREFIRLRQLLRRGSLLALAWLLPAALGCLGLSVFFIPFAYGPDFAPAIPTLAIMLFGFVIMNLVFWSRSVLVAVGRIGYTTWAALAVTVLKVVLTLLFVPSLGYLALAGVLSVTYIVAAYLLYSEITRYWASIDAITPLSNVSKL